MAKISYVSAEDLEKGDMIDVGEVASEEDLILGASLDDVATVDYVEDADRWHVRVVTDIATLTILRETLFPYEGSADI